MKINSRKVRLSVELNTRATMHITLVWCFAPWERTVSPFNKSNNSEPDTPVLQGKSPLEFASICCTILTLSGLTKDHLSFTDRCYHTIISE